MTEPTFDFSAFLSSPGGGQGTRTVARAPAHGDAGAGPPALAPDDLASLMGGGELGMMGANMMGGNDLFDMPWESLAPLDPFVAASVPPAAIDDPLASAFNNNEMLARHRPQSFHGLDKQGAATLLDPTQAPSAMLASDNSAGAMDTHRQMQQQLDAAADDSTMDTRLAYRAQILAHHSHLLRNGAGGDSARNGLPVKPLPRGMASAPAVPLSSAHPSRAMQITQQAQRLSLQERRRQARIEQSKARGKGKESDNMQVAGRKRPAPGPERISPQKPPPFMHKPHSSSLLASQPVLVAPTQMSTPNTAPSDHAMEPPAMPAPAPPNLPLETIYSSSGFDMLKALMRVAARPNPTVKIGPVDLSCSFTVSDATLPDQPLIYVSDTFCRLTGYERRELYGRNCRLLQSPDGIVAQGSERTSTDNQAVAHMRKYVSGNKECQASLINYRKDGQPFINLVTIVPITWDDTDTIRYLIGFQVDLIEQPGAILEKMPDGSYYVNYSSTSMASSGSFDSQPMLKDASMTTIADSISQEQEEAQRRLGNAQSIAETIEGGHNDTKHWARLLLDNSHDLIYVLSLKGTFLYVSPSSERMLGFKPTELIGKSISEFIHPSDVVPVFRELKDSTSNANIAAAARTARAAHNADPRNRNQPMRDVGPAVNLLFRMRTKAASYQWIESVGKLHLEQGKGRKVVVSSGRARPFYQLSSRVMAAVAASAEPGFWSKMSLDGLFLNVSAPVVNTLGITAHQMAGKTFKELCDQDSLPALHQSLRTPSTTLILHSLIDSMANRIPVLSTFYPSTLPADGDQALNTHQSVWMQTRRAPPDLSLQPNVVYSSPPTEGDPNDASDTSVFAELSPFRSSSWCYELHQLRNLNKRLKEQVRAAHQRRASHAQSDAANDKEALAPEQSPRLTDAAMKDLIYPNSFIGAYGPSSQPAVKPPWNHEGALPSSSKDPRPSSSLGNSTPVDSLLAISGSNSDATRSTSLTTPSQGSGERSGSGSAGERSGSGSATASGDSSAERSPAGADSATSASGSGADSGGAKKKGSRHSRRKSAKPAGNKK